jgi:transcription termination factor Rho
MAIKPSPDRSDLESKTREDLQTIAKVKGVEAPTRATKAALIEAIMGDLPTTSDTPVGDDAPASRAVRSRRTVATPEDDFEDLLGEFVAEPKSETRTETRTETVPASEPALTESVAPSTAATVTVASASGATPCPTPTSPTPANSSRSKDLLDLRDDGYGFLRTKSYHPSPNDVYVSINQVRRYHLRKGDTIVGGFRPAASNEKYPALLRVDSVAGSTPRSRDFVRASRTSRRSSPTRS